MALKRAFRAADRIQYTMWPAPAAPPLVHYYDYLISSPRIYQEELFCFVTAASAGVLYVTPEANANGPTTINFFSVIATVAWPSWGSARWRFDGQAGSLLGVDHLGASNAIFYDAITVEPNGSLWWWGLHADAYRSGPNEIDRTTFDPVGTTSPYPTSSFLDKNGDPVVSCLDFAIDRAADRVFARWSSNYLGEVSIHRLSTREYLGAIFTPNKTCGIILTHDGYAYVADVADWLCVYDYAGVFQGALRNPRRQAYSAGVVYGWDRYYKRLLFTGAIPNAADGACKMRIWGYYPVPDAAGVTPPIPRQVPRAARRVYVFSRAYGEGGEPLAARSATATGLDVVSGVTDQDGDAILSLTGGAPGSLAVSIAVDVLTTPADAAETDPAAVVGRTLELTLDQPATVTQTSTPSYPHTAPIPCQVTIGSNGVGPYTAVFSFDTGLSHVEATVSDAGPVLSTTATLTVQTWNVAVVVTDSASTPNHGQASKQGGINVT